MNRRQLAHLLRASAHIAGDQDILVIGSQAILGSFDEDDLPAPATASREVALAFLDDPDGHKADLVDGAIGEPRIHIDMPLRLQRPQRQMDRPERLERRHSLSPRAPVRRAPGAVFGPG
jgi:hypothetical protein